MWRCGRCVASQSALDWGDSPLSVAGRCLGESMYSFGGLTNLRLGSVPLHPRSSGRERLAVCNQLHCHYADPLFHAWSLRGENHPDAGASSYNLSIKERKASEGRPGAPAFDPPMPKGMMDLAKEKLTRTTLLMYAASERAASHWQDDSEAKSQQLREADERNRGLAEQLAEAERNLAEQLAQADQITTVFQAQVAELKEVVRRKDEQIEVLEVAAAKATSLEAEVAKLTQALADLEVSWKSKCERAAMTGHRLFREGEVYKR
ncbi:hypothetical protein ACLB2K_004396 [Fragaria x ananassa]